MKRRQRAIQFGFFAWGFGLLIYIAPFVGITYRPPFSNYFAMVYLAAAIPLVLYAGRFQIPVGNHGIGALLKRALPRPLALILVIQTVWVFTVGSDAPGESTSASSHEGVQSFGLVMGWLYGCFTFGQQLIINLMSLYEEKVTPSPDPT